MSIAPHHTEWLSLVPVSGPFLSLPVLMEAFPQGLDAHDPDHFRLLRQEYESWLDSLEEKRGDPAPHHNWIKFVVTKTLDLDEQVLLEGQTIPQTLQIDVPEHQEFLRPSVVVIDPSTKKPRLLIQTYPQTQDLSSYVAGSPWKASPDTRMTELLHATGVRLGLVTNGEHWMLVNAPKGETTGYASWYAETLLEEKITLQAFRSLLSAGRFFNVPDDQTLDAPKVGLLDKSASNQQEVTDQLGYQVRRAVEVLIHEIAKIEHEPEIDAELRKLISDIPEAVLYESALTVMMRLVFLFCAEERELIPSKPFPVYEQNYSVATISKQLRELADQHDEALLERRYDAWPRLLSAFRAVYGGLRHDDVHIPAYGGSLFNPDRFPFLEGRKSGTSWRDVEASPLPVSNRTVLHLLEALQYLETKVAGSSEKTLRRLSFRALDIEQIGHVYEGLLDHTAKRATEPFLGLDGTKDKEPEIPLAVLEEKLAKGENDLLKFLKGETGKSESALKKMLKVEIDSQDAARFRTVCQGDDALWERVQPFAGLVRPDNFGYPVVIPKGTVFVTAGTDRRSSGTHYTPKSLTEPIVQYTLEPLVYVGPAEGMPKNEWKLKSAKELLDLKICDMACGSGAFLVQAARYMAERLMEAWDFAKLANPNTPGITPDGEPSTGKANEALIPDDPAERKTYAMRIIAQRCLYGVDINPLAAEMAKLSLWLLTVSKDKPFEFLDHSIRCGDSLVGIYNLNQLRDFSLRNDSPNEMRYAGPLDSEVEVAISLRLKLEDLPANTVEDIERQERLLKEAEDKIAQLRCSADLLVSAEFWGENAKDKQERVRHAAVVSGYHIEKGPTEDFQQAAENERRGQKMFHWPLEFPEVIVNRGGFDAFVGNPPFMGGRRIRSAFGVRYLHWLTIHASANGSGNSDLCAFFFLAANRLLHKSGTFGLVSTNTIAQGDTRETGLSPIIESGTSLVRAHSSHKWPGTANITAALVWGKIGDWKGECLLNEVLVKQISSFLTEPGSFFGDPYRLSANDSISFQGSILVGMGFVIDAAEASSLLSSSPKNKEVIFRYLNGNDLNSDPEHSPSRYVINFFDRPLGRSSSDASLDESVAMDYPECLRLVQERVFPERTRKNANGDFVLRKPLPQKWWIYGDKRPELYSSLVGKHRAFAAVRHSKHWIIANVRTDVVFSDALVVFSTERFCDFAILQSSLHDLWAWHYCSTIRDAGIRYSPTDGFVTFPFPLNSEQLESVGSRYSQFRSALMLDQKIGVTEVYNRYHDPRSAPADTRILREMHIEMDQAVIAAYGWTDLDLDHGFHETKQGVRFTISEPARREVLQRLLKLNHERYAEEVKQGLHSKKGAASSNKKSKQSGRDSDKKLKAKEPSLFGDEDDEPASEPEVHVEDREPKQGTRMAEVDEALPRAIPIEEIDTDQVMAAFRQAARNRGWMTRQELLKEVSLILGYLRMGAKIEEALRNHLRAAIRRWIIEADGPDLVRAGTLTLADYGMEGLRESFRSVMRQGTTYEREEVIQSLARYLGFARVTENSREAMKSAINSAIRQGILGYEGTVVWREE